MNQKKLERIIKFLRDNNVSHIKTLKYEITLSVLAAPFVAAAGEVAKEEDAPPTGAAIPPTENAIPHHVNEVANLLKLSDEDLVDKLFPAQVHESPAGDS